MFCFVNFSSFKKFEVKALEIIKIWHVLKFSHCASSDTKYDIEKYFQIQEGTSFSKDEVAKVFK